MGISLKFKPNIGGGSGGQLRRDPLITMKKTLAVIGTLALNKKLRNLLSLRCQESGRLFNDNHKRS